MGGTCAAAPGEAMDRRNMRRGSNFCMVVMFSVVLLVGITKIHAMVTFCDDESPTAGEFEREIDPRIMLSAAELKAESNRRIVLEAETRRFLATKKKTGYHVSYTALSAGRTPCPPRSGRSYYTPRCQSATGPARPYSRGCTTMSRCGRDSS